MPAKDIHTLIIGAGPSGIAAAHRLTEAGVSPLIVERGETAGGLMRSLRRGDFILDLGRKELYTRIPEVDQLWHRILGDDYRQYPHRVGSLYRGQILEMSGRYRGLRRGLPWPWLIAGGLDLLLCWGCSARSQPSNYADYWYRRAGRRFARVFAQGYWEKFRGQRWAEMPVPQVEADGNDDASYSFNAIKHGLMLAAQGGPSAQRDWRHPAKGTGQIYDAMLREALSRGAQIQFKTEVIELKSAGEHVVEVLTKESDGPGIYRPRHVVSSMQIEDLTSLLSERSVEMTAVNGCAAREAERSVVLVYLFSSEPPAFPHAWLEVNDPRLKAGRITNYAAFNGEMIPPGKTCLCVEFFCFGDDPILRLSPEELKNLAIQECVASALIDATKLIDTFVATMRRSNAASGWRDWQSTAKLRLLERTKQFVNLYYVNRPGADWATFAGLMAAEAILRGCRAEFDRRADPTRNCALAQAATAARSEAREKLGRDARSGGAGAALATIWRETGNVRRQALIASESDHPSHERPVGRNRPGRSEPEVG
jgi:protoporphyrinogen oxidase